MRPSFLTPVVAPVMEREAIIALRSMRHRRPRLRLLQRVVALTFLTPYPSYDRVSSVRGGFSVQFIGSSAQTRSPGQALRAVRLSDILLCVRLLHPAILRFLPDHFREGISWPRIPLPSSLRLRSGSSFSSTCIASIHEGSVFSTLKGPATGRLLPHTWRGHDLLYSALAAIDAFDLNSPGYARALPILRASFTVGPSHA